MNMLMVDVTDAEGRDGDEVVLLGEQGSQSITADEIASASGTIAYEIVSRLNPRLPRRVVGELPDEGNIGRGPVERR
jgi:alanine racemase